MSPTCGRCDSGHCDERKTRSHAGRVTWQHSRGRGEGRQGRGVDQPEHDEREAERPHPGGTAWGAADERDPNNVIEPARESDAGNGGAPIRLIN